MFHFESKIYEIDNEDEEEVNSNGPIFPKTFIALDFFHFLRSSIFGAEPITHSTQGVHLVIVTTICNM